eukprot:TRINITY_DN4935_c0_g2_i1.p1 TRINITY_DN4935_c0_g2~~TRINITY_DN4935_c0_g2_i1.p1  ORF type:complete len:329 (+),score=66.11 TRINITY_DN4935_c0_g2_i1:49-1035(+)
MNYLKFNSIPSYKLLSQLLLKVVEKYLNFINNSQCTQLQTKLIDCIELFCFSDQSIESSFIINGITFDGVLKKHSFDDDSNSSQRRINIVYQTFSNQTFSNQTFSNQTSSNYLVNHTVNQFNEKKIDYLIINDKISESILNTLYHSIYPKIIIDQIDKRLIFKISNLLNCLPAPTIYSNSKDLECEKLDYISIGSKQLLVIPSNYCSTMILFYSTSSFLQEIIEIFNNVIMILQRIIEDLIVDRESVTFLYSNGEIERMIIEHLQQTNDSFINNDLKDAFINSILSISNILQNDKNKSKNYAFELTQPKKAIIKNASNFAIRLFNTNV